MLVVGEPFAQSGLPLDGSNGHAWPAGPQADNITRLELTVGHKSSLTLKTAASRTDLAKKLCIAWISCVSQTKFKMPDRARLWERRVTSRT